MPLAAVVDGQRVVAFLLDEPEWTLLRADLRTGSRTAVMTCGAKAFGRTSKLGTAHFVHERGAACEAHGPESAQHLLAKKIITEAAIECGWEATPEQPGPDGTWIADVLATRGAMMVALEVQWSRQDFGTYKMRQDRYAADGVRGAWFARHTDHLPRMDQKDLPLFGLSIDDIGQTVTVNDQQVDLREAVIALLTGRLQYRTTRGFEGGRWRVTLFEETCYRCKRPFTFWDVVASAPSPCGSTVRVESPVWPVFRLEAHPDVLTAVNALSTRSALAKTFSRYTHALGATYEAFVCPCCDATAGDHFLEQKVTVDDS